ncbi:MAG: SHOCT domain-containing protein [Myxococcota bacterium]
MSDPRVTGLMLMGLSIAAFMGTTSGNLPSVTFFPALVLFGLGAIKFLRTNREAMGAAEEKTKQKLNPVIRQNLHAHAHAERQSSRRGAGLQDINAAMGDRPRASQAVPLLNAIEIDESDESLELDSDVSFPVELQQGDKLADQLSKLSTLLEQGVLSAEEYAVAKTKLLG